MIGHPCATGRASIPTPAMGTGVGHDKIGHRVATRHLALDPVVVQLLRVKHRPYSSGSTSLLVNNHKRVVPQVNEFFAVGSKQLVGYV